LKGSRRPLDAKPLDVEVKAQDVDNLIRAVDGCLDCGRAALLLRHLVHVAFKFFDNGFRVKDRVGWLALLNLPHLFPPESAVVKRLLIAALDLVP